MSELRRQQLAFAAHLRDPQAHPPPPGIEPRRLAVYRELFFNGIAGLLEAQLERMRSKPALVRTARSRPNEDAP